MDKVSARLIVTIEVVLCLLGLTVLFAPRGCGMHVYAAVGIATATLASRIETYALDCGRAPADLDALVARDDCTGWLGPYAKPADLVDPWGRRFVWLRVPGTGFSAVCTFGADGVIGGRDRCAAIEPAVDHSKPLANNGPSVSTAPTSHPPPSGRGTPR